MKVKEGKELDFSKGYFMANGVKYYYYGDISKFGIKRFRKWQNMEPVITFGKTFSSIHKELESAIDLINKSKAVHGHKILFDLYTCIGENLDNRIDPVLEACTLFIVTEGEDMSDIDDTKSQEKIKNWEKEGISYQSFFTYVTNMVPQYIERCTEISQNFIQKEKKKKKPSTKKE